MSRAVAAEALGSFLLFATVIGSGIMGETLSSGNAGLALLGNTFATGAMLYVLITIFGPLSGAHFNPAVTLVITLRGEIAAAKALRYGLAQLGGGIAGVWAAHAMFALPVLQLSDKVRNGPGQWFSEALATFGLLLTILGTRHARNEAVPTAVAFYIVAAYWFTSSTSFANPAITLARCLSNSFAGISPANVPAFIAAQIVGALLAHLVARRLFTQPT